MNYSTLIKIAASAGVAIGGAAIANAAISASSPRLEEWYEGEKAAYFWRGFRIAYTIRGAGRPVLLLHGIHAAASSFEWRHNFEHLGNHYRVYAPDLLGFGHSDRPAIDYTADSYVSMLVDFVRDVFDEPPAVVASSHSAAFAAEVAYRAPSLLAGLVLVCPTGIDRKDQRGVLNMISQGALTSPIVGQTLYNVLVSEASIRYFLENQVFADPKAIDAAIVRQMYATSHQSGARYAPASFVGGALDLDISETYPRLSMPTLTVWGDSATSAPKGDLDRFAKGNDKVRTAIAEGAGLLPHDEAAGWFNSSVRDFLG